MMAEKLATWVPDIRPRRIAHTLHGDVEIYAELSAEDMHNGRQFRHARSEIGMTLGLAAWLLGLTTVELSECERGIRRFVLEEALAMLKDDPRDRVEK